MEHYVELLAGVHSNSGNFCCAFHIITDGTYCKYHIVWIPKCRRKVLYGNIRKELGEIFRQLARQRECEVLEGHLCSDHVHMYMSIPPKYSVAQVVGYIKGKRAIHIDGNCCVAKHEKQEPFGTHF